MLNTPEYQKTAVEMLDQINQLIPDKLKPYEEQITAILPDFFIPIVQRLECDPIKLLDHLAEANKKIKLTRTGFKTLETLFRDKKLDRKILGNIFKVAKIYIEDLSFDTLCALSTRSSLELRFWIELGIHENVIDTENHLNYENLLDAVTILDKMIAELEKIETDDDYSISDENLQKAF